MAPGRFTARWRVLHPGKRSLPLPAVLLALMVVTALPELVCTAADLGLVSPPRLRALAYDYGGFWPGLLRDWRPNYTLQPWAMFLTYGFLHGGLLHLGVNLVTLGSLGSEVVSRVGPWRFLLIYGAALLGGALGFGLLASTLRPMVGASGALFGLAGALLAWAWAARPPGRLGAWPVVRAILLLALLNLVMWWAMNGQLAWQTHLGGFLAGWGAARFLGDKDRGCV